jgi:hypothetical protein
MAMPPPEFEKGEPGRRFGLDRDRPRHRRAKTDSIEGEALMAWWVAASGGSIP